MSRLVAANLYREARDAWIRLSGRKGGEFVNDGQFRRLNPAGEGPPFEWAWTRMAGVSLRPESSARIGNVTALHITAEGRPSGSALEQVLVLFSGTYVLATWTRETTEGSLKSVDWQLSCLGGQARPEMSLRPPSPSSNGWQRLEKIVTIPLACPAQRLELRVEHDENRDLDAWIRSVEVQRLS